MSKDWISAYVDVADFTGLFVEELNWQRPSRGGRTVKIPIDDKSVELGEVATFRGVSVWSCPEVPPGKVQREIDRFLRKESAERVVIFHDGDHQMWRWPQARDAGGSGAARLVTHEHRVGRPNEALRQRLKFIELGIDEDVSVLEVVRRLHRAFDSDKITKSFYTQFAKQHRELTAVITGIEVSDKMTKPELRWYGSLLLNRLMFIYFMQRKGFLDNDSDYLRNRLRRIRNLERPGSFYEFYKDFLIPLFHEGLGADLDHRHIADPTIEALLGDVPYVNGGIFSEHPLEVSNDIRVPDIAFEKVFDFFDQWQWHLDDRPTGNPNEINPDVLGYIFEQFVNNREELAKGNKVAATNADKGAYYTKEDVTGYMTASTLIPVFLERIEARAGVNPWRHVAAEPDRYVWASVRHGCDVPLPDAIATEADAWPRPAWDSTEVTSDFALPAETWWEVVDRRKHFGAVCERARKGEINTVADAVTNNLDMETLAIDVIDALDNPDDVVAAWEILTELRVIDPTCGSGAFLFAALNILHRLFAAVFESADLHALTARNAGLARILDQAAEHPDRDYFLLKHAAINNLYGLDLMPEAVEIARLRLFLKLIAQIDARADIEPLPDLEFNIRSGNALVGALDEQAIRDKVDLLSSDRVDDLVIAAARTAEAYREFAAAQETADHAGMLAAKREVLLSAGAARDELDEWWRAADAPRLSLSAYRNVYHPFHWFIEFPEAFADGGFDVVIGNPPYVGTTKINYEYSGFRTDTCPDIYAPCLERATQIAKPDGRLSMIVPISSQFGEDFRSLRSGMKERFRSLWIATFDRRPDSLFGAHVGVRSVIWTCGNDRPLPPHVTRTNRWALEFRPHLFETIKYFESSARLSQDGWIRLSSDGMRQIFDSLLLTQSRGIAASTTKRGRYSLGFKGNALYFLSVFIDPPPVIEADGSIGTPSMMGSLYFDDRRQRDAALALLLSKLAFVWWGFTSDNLNVTVSGIASTPVDIDRAPKDFLDKLANYGALLVKELPKHVKTSTYRQRQVSRYVIPDLRHITDEVDDLIAREFGFVELLPDLELAYATLFKGRDDEDG